MLTMHGQPHAKQIASADEYKHRCSQKLVLTWNIRYGILEKANTDQCFFESEMKHIVHSFRYQMPPGDQ